MRIDFDIKDFFYYLYAVWFIALANLGLVALTKFLWNSLI